MSGSRGTRRVWWAGPPAENDSYLSLVAFRVSADDAFKHAHYIARAASNQEAD